jgi:hypothetical protein
MTNGFTRRMRVPVMGHRILDHLYDWIPNDLHGYAQAGCLKMAETVKYKMRLIALIISYDSRHKGCAVTLKLRHSTLYYLLEPEAPEGH